jgi:hypothetical protein
MMNISAVSSIYESYDNVLPLRTSPAIDYLFLGLLFISDVSNIRDTFSRRENDDEMLQTHAHASLPSSFLSRPHLQ